MGARGPADALAEALSAMGGEEQARKLHELQEKQSTGDLYIAFCGHFSAGKSTLINRLCGHRLLPSGPIPTSANVVRIRNGEASARVYRKREGSELRVERIPLEELELHCKDGEGIETVEIRYPVPLLGSNVVLLDTPGIDSTDDAHQAATQSAMHLADVVFYVMDYNYVQSEINFTFAKKLQEAGKPLYLIVNQIDKHREQELPFEAYREGVREAFRNWNIKPAGVLFLSLKNEGLPGNEWRKLPALLQALADSAERLKDWNMGQTALHLAREALRDWREKRELEKALYLEACGGMEGREAILREEELIRKQEAALLGRTEQLQNRWKKELQTIMDNANLTPAATRDLAAAYLETRKPGFKAGFLARASKTEEERARRLEAFRRDLEEKLRAHLYWHVSDYLKREADQIGAADPTFLQELEDRLTVSLSSEWLAGLVHAGPDFTGEYVLNYCRLLASELKTSCRQACLGFVERLGNTAAAGQQEETRLLDTRKQEHAVRMAAAKGLERMEQEEQAKETELLELVESRSQRVEGGSPFPDPAAMETEQVLVTVGGGGEADQAAPGESMLARGEPLLKSRLLMQDRAVQDGKGKPQEGAYTANGQLRLKETAERLQLGATALEGLPGAEPVIRSLQERAAKLLENRFTLALFGAFSAGKSSFANALMGNRVLPVSPNPTTAAINMILPPEERFPHGTVRVHLKTEAEMLEEMAFSLKAMGLDVSAEESHSANSLLDRIRKLSPSDATPAGKPHLTFLKAVEKGWAAMAPSLGTILTEGLSLFRSYVAEETKSCFAHLVELYHETPLSAHGIVLVDTPGADSINARHTGVAFNYIKNADAILFVTYYNHAFSQADREFLLQLGRVKDAMQLDKMFFIVNAADLASGQEELEGVLRHVEENLLRFGIRNPRLFPVSSQLAVEAKLAGDAGLLSGSGLPFFETELQRFALQELGGMAVRSAEQELRSADALLGRWLQAARADEGEREKKRGALAAAEAQALELCAIRWESSDRNDFRKELEEQLYYVKQRIGFRFSETYRTAFNPSALREDAGDLKRAFKAAWRDLVRLVGYQLSQEVLAVTLRMENYLNLTFERKWAKVSEEAAKLEEGFGKAGFEPRTYRTPKVDESPETEDPEVKWLLGYYRSGKQFFEGGGSGRLQEALQVRLQQAVDVYLQRHAERMLEDYGHQAEAAAEECAAIAAEAIRSHRRGMDAAWSRSMDAEQLTGRKQQLEQLLANLQ